MSQPEGSNRLRPPIRGGGPSASQRTRQTRSEPRLASSQSGRFPQVTPMSRSCSNTSDISSRLQDGRKRQRGKRIGPLSQEQAADAALTRQVGACGDCRRRKVKVRKCKHHGSSRSGSPAPGTAQLHIRPDANHQPAALPPATPTTGQRHGSLPRQEASSIDMDLRGLSANPANHPLRHPPSATNDDILSELHAAPSSGPSTTHLRGPSTFSSVPRRVSSSLPISSASGPVFAEQFATVGREVSHQADLWECQWPHSSDGTESLVSFKSDGASCLKQFPGSSGLIRHYRASHGALRRSDWPFMWKCRACQWMSPAAQKCLQCSRAGGPGWENWCYGYVAGPGKASSLLLDLLESPPTSVGSSYEAHHLVAALDALGPTLKASGSNYSGGTSLSGSRNITCGGAGCSQFHGPLSQEPRGSRPTGSNDGFSRESVVGDGRVSSGNMPEGDDLSPRRRRRHGKDGGRC
ncbi:hypothetical protein GE09DRAFT_1129328 [Coniochaeta sp. 2T2.1]|nr:hypothetical protein GE09DRAFT_1129328 [Coniochaeta sp. 2T2.1]